MKNAENNCNMTNPS